MVFPLFALVAMPARAAWYWPFGGDEDSEKRPRLHRVLENANDLIEQAEDAAIDGDSERALELYNSALTNLVDIAEKNPDRAEKPEFAPLRNKIAATTAAMDSIRFAQVNQNIRAVAVTDTTELQKKYRKKQETGMKYSGSYTAGNRTFYIVKLDNMEVHIADGCWQIARISYSEGQNTM